MTPDVIELGALLAPIPGDEPAGTDLREDLSPTALYYQVKDARSAARAAERQAEAADEETGLLDAWRTILKLGPEVLAQTSKDLEVAAWYIEALVRAHGFAGLRDGFKLAKGLVEGYWDAIYPRPDEDGVATTVAPFAGLNGEGAEGTLIRPLRRIPLTQGSSEGPFALWHYEQAVELAAIQDPDRRQKRIDAGAVTMERLETAVRETPAASFQTLVGDIEGCLVAYDQLNEQFYNRAGQDAPPYSQIRGMLETCLDAVKVIARDKLAVTASGPDATAAAQAGAQASTGGSPAGGPVAAGGSVSFSAAGQVQGREDAFRVLLQVADFFRKAEPHSPISYTLEELVRRGRMSLPQLLAELLPDPEQRKTFLVHSGAKPPPDGESY